MLSYLSDPAGGYSVLAEGGTEPGSEIAQFKIEAPSGSLSTVKSNDGYFIGELPGTVAARDQIPSGGPYVLTGYNAAGTALLHEDLADLVNDLPPSQAAHH